MTIQGYPFASQMNASPIFKSILRWPAEKAIEETLARPEKVVESLSDPDARLYYRFYLGTRVGDKYLCVIVKLGGEDAFVVTAYLTDRAKRGVLIWPKEK